MILSRLKSKQFKMMYDYSHNCRLFSLQWLEMCQESPLGVCVLFSSLGSLIGALLTGLAVILDWNEPWQKFPLPNTFGAIFGESCGIILSLAIYLLIKDRI